MLQHTNKPLCPISKVLQVDRPCCAQVAHLRKPFNNPTVGVRKHLLSKGWGSMSFCTKSAAGLGPPHLKTPIVDINLLKNTQKPLPPLLCEATLAMAHASRPRMLRAWCTSTEATQQPKEEPNNKNQAWCVREHLLYKNKYTWGQKFGLV